MLDPGIQALFPKQERKSLKKEKRKKKIFVKAITLHDKSEKVPAPLKCTFSSH